jgi:rubrerythrin
MKRSFHFKLNPGLEHRFRVMNRRNTMRILVDLRETLDQTAKKIAQDEPNPERWDTAVLYLLEALEAEAEEHENGIQVYETMLQKVRDALSDQIEDRTWGY